MVSHGQMVLRIVVGAALGGVIGFERSRHGRPAGLRTHLLVAMASATFMVVSAQFVHWQQYSHDDLVEVDGSRIAASVVSGIGFLAGGAIFRTGATVQGLTTAAGLWLVSAIGLCAGGGMFVEAVVVTGLGVIALSVLRRFEDKDDGHLRRRLMLVLGEESPGLAQIEEALHGMGASVSELDYERRLDDKKKIAVTLEVRVPANLAMAELVARIERQPGVRRVHVKVPS
jgi:putative Mg2+ transporter-C (MgtC) family protein